MEKRTRAPIVCVLGHVDHGKTTLLDKIRKTNIAQKEAGGITQSIGASVIQISEGKEITFIDTPGHAAFKAMRSRGAKVADIAILVIAADDGLKPQTKEALEAILNAQVPYIVAITKIDLPSASVETVKEQLGKEGILLEGRGGDVPVVPISSKTGEGIEDLLEMVTLVAEVHEIRGNPNAPLEAVVIETSKGKSGPLVSVVIRNGTLKVQDEIVSETVKARIRGLFDDKVRMIKEVGPGKPAQVLGFSDLPVVGSRIWHLASDKEIPVIKIAKPIQLEPKKDETPIVIKAGSTGALEALLANIPKGIFVVSSGVGDVNENDVFTAKAVELASLSHKACLFAFESKVPTTVVKLAETEGILIKKFDVIYELFEDLEKMVKEKDVEILGKAQVIATFPFNSKKIAGCKILQGKITKGDTLVLTRNGKRLGEIKISSMKKQKTDIVQAGPGEECGLLFTPQLDFQVGDVILSVTNK